MKNLLIILTLMTVAACSTVSQVSDKVYKVECHKFAGNCQEKIAETCPYGHKINVDDSGFKLFKGPTDVYFFECRDKRNPAKQ